MFSVGILGISDPKINDDVCGVLMVQNLQSSFRACTSEGC